MRIAFPTILTPRHRSTDRPPPTAQTARTAGVVAILSGGWRSTVRDACARRTAASREVFRIFAALRCSRARVEMIFRMHGSCPMRTIIVLMKRTSGFRGDTHCRRRRESSVADRVDSPDELPAPLESRDDVSLVQDDPPFRWQRRVGLIPRGGLGIGRRALFWTAFAWLPIAVWAWWAGRALPEQGQAAEPLLQHFGVHARLLLGIPLLILAEAVGQRIMHRLIPQFVRSGIVPPAEVPRFRAILARTARLRSATLPWVIMVGLAIAWAFTGSVVHRAHELLWAAEGGAVPSLGFGGWWYVYVGRPIFLVLLLGWLWRLILLAPR
jgi:hypothetical protein